jgi:hypothetical protein
MTGRGMPTVVGLAAAPAPATLDQLVGAVVQRAVVPVAR